MNFLLFCPHFLCDPLPSLPTSIQLLKRIYFVYGLKRNYIESVCTLCKQTVIVQAKYLFEGSKFTCACQMRLVQCDVYKLP